MTPSPRRLPVAALCFAGVLLLASHPDCLQALTGEPHGCCVRADAAPSRPAATAGAEQFLESEHFVVSYFTSGSDSVWRADLPQLLSEDLEYAYGVLSGDPRAAMHVPLGTFPVDGGPNKVQVFVEVIVPGYDGLACYIWPSSALDAPCSTSADGYLRIRNAIQGRAELRRIAAHELMHLFQYAIDPFEPSWAKESTASWAEAFVFPQDRDRMVSWSSLIHHTDPVWGPTRGSLKYSSLYWDFLDLDLGESLPPKIWAKACGLGWDAAAQQLLADHGLDLDDSLHHYAVWNYYTGRRADGLHYPYSDLPEILPDALFVNYPIVDAELSGDYAQETGSNYVFFAGAATRRHLRVRLHGSPEWAQHRIMSWIGTTGANTHAESPPLDPSQEEFLVPNWYRYDQLALVVTNGATGGQLDPQALRYSICAAEEGDPVLDLAGREGNLLLTSTNPSTAGAAIRYRSTGAAHPTQVAIYDVGGRRVQRLVDRRLPSGDYVEFWDGSSETGSRVAAGTYLLFLRHDGGTASHRFVLLR